MSRRGVNNRGFTLAELFVVVLILLAVLSIAVPAFTGLLASSERSLAENAVRIATIVAKDEASLGDGDVALFFIDDPTPDPALDAAVREPPGLRLVVARYVGTIEDAAEDSNPFVGPAFQTRARDVFVGIPTAPSVKLPGDWWVAGLAPAGTLDREWYDGPGYTGDGMGDANGEAFERVVASRNWLLPQAGLYDRELFGEGATTDINNQPAPTFTPRQTFMIRFSSETGRVVNGGNQALLIDPRPSLAQRRFTDDPLSRFGVSDDQTPFTLRVDLAEDLRAWARDLIERQDIDGDGLTGESDPAERELRRALIGNYSHDTVLAEPVSRIALFRMTDLAQGLFARGLNEETRSIFRPDISLNTAKRDRARDPRFDASSDALWPDTANANATTIRQSLNAWMEGNTVPENQGSQELPLDSSQPPDFILVQSGVVEPTRAEQQDRPLATVLQVVPATGELVGVER
jgi:hypothetical protein